MFTTPLLLLALSASAFANIYTTSPIASSNFNAGKQAIVSWQDDGKTPSLSAFGPTKVSVYVGNAQQQTSLQTIVASVNVSSTSSIQFTPDPTIGPNSGEYFIRFESLDLKDASQPQFPALAFSSKFTLNSMTGQFSDAVQAQINGQSTAPIAGATSAPAAASSGSAPAASATVTKSSSASGTSTKASASATHSSAAGHVQAGWFGVLIGAILGVSMF